MIMLRSFVLVLLGVNAIKASDHVGACDLNCVNGGRCAWVSDSVTELETRVNRGLMIQQCECPPGYGGTGCEIEFPRCSLPDRKCADGSDCIRRKDGEYVCDCLVHDNVDPFAGELCRRPVTEYCGVQYYVDRDTPYCTNGGKCYSSFIAATLGGGSIELREEYSHMGCVCNQNFYGPHCEHLKHDREHIPKKNRNPTTKTPGDLDSASDSAGGSTTFIEKVKLDDIDLKYVALAGAGLMLLISFTVLYKSYKNNNRDDEPTSTVIRSARKTSPVAASALYSDAGSIYLDDESLLMTDDEKIMEILGKAEDEVEPLYNEDGKPRDFS